MGVGQAQSRSGTLEQMYFLSLRDSNPESFSPQPSACHYTIPDTFFLVLLLKEKTMLYFALKTHWIVQKEQFHFALNVKQLVSKDLRYKQGVNILSRLIWQPHKHFCRKKWTKHFLAPSYGFHLRPERARLSLLSYRLAQHA